VWAVPVARDGTFQTVLPASDSYAITALGGLRGATTVVRAGTTVDATIEVSSLTPPPDEVTRWLQSQVALASASPDAATVDLAPVGEMIGGARVVGLGEATHGSREFFQLKHRLLEYLVTDKGFTTFAIEASQPECRAIDAYIHGAPTDPATIAHALGYWTWRTEEVLALIEWMRTWNASHAQQLSFVGFDMQSARVAAQTVAGYLRDNLRDRPDLAQPLALIAGDDEIGAFFALSPEQQRAFEMGVDAIARAFDDRGVTGDVRHDVTILQEWTAGNLEPDDDVRSAMRDRAMAANVAWAIGERDKAVVWAHNMRVDRGAMGGALAARFRNSYVAFGFLFERGAFRAVAGSSVDEVRVGAPPAYDISEAFARTHIPILVADLRAAPRGIVADWLAAPHPMREFGATYSADEDSEMARLSHRFDAVIFVDATTASRPLR
jgi:erythromycin esterase